MAQLFKSRKGIPAVPGLPTTHKSTASVFDRQRLHQRPRSTYILEGYMFLFALVAMLAADTEHVLPRIQVALPLMQVYLQAYFPRQSGVRTGSSGGEEFDGYLFSVGWWGKAGSPENRVGVDIGKAEKAG